MKSTLTRAFNGWVDQAPQRFASIIRSGSMELAEELQASGYSLRAEAFDGSGVPDYALNFEKTYDCGEVGYILILFDRHFRPRFQVVFGRKGLAPSFPWVRAGSLSQREDSELQRYKWWGAPWWGYSKANSLSSAFHAVHASLPRVITYLEFGAAGNNIRIENIG